MSFAKKLGAVVLTAAVLTGAGAGIANAAPAPGLSRPRAPSPRLVKPTAGWLRTCYSAALCFRAAKAPKSPLPTEPSFVPGKVGLSV